VFLHKNDASMHIESVHVDHEFICPVCIRSLKTRKGFKKHFKRVHPSIALDTLPLPEFDVPSSSTSTYRAPAAATESVTEASFESDASDD
jgi:hypothetical protein